MNDIKLYAKKKQDIDSLIHLTLVFSSDIGMTFGLARCGRLIVNRDKEKSTGRISLPEDQIDDIDQSYKYFGILQLFGNEYRNLVRRVLRSKLSSKNKVTTVNTFDVPVIQYPVAADT